MADCLKHNRLVANNLEQLAEALGDENRWFAGEHLGHPPTDCEAIEYYITNGGAIGHRARLSERGELAGSRYDHLAVESLEQVIEAFGDCNRWFAGEHLGHAPNNAEALEYYLTHGGAAGHSQRVAKQQAADVKNQTG